MMEKLGTVRSWRIHYTLAVMNSAVGAEFGGGEK
jgi:hypothetical protein